MDSQAQASRAALGALSACAGRPRPCVCFTAVIKLSLRALHADHLWPPSDRGVIALGCVVDIHIVCLHLIETAISSWRDPGPARGRSDVRPVTATRSRETRCTPLHSSISVLASLSPQHSSSRCQPTRSQDRQSRGSSQASNTRYHSPLGPPATEASVLEFLDVTCRSWHSPSLSAKWK